MRGVILAFALAAAVGVAGVAVFSATLGQPTPHPARVSAAKHLFLFF